MGAEIIVVGAGIIGASIAYQLAKSGKAVTVIDQDMPGAGASGRSFGWINASFYLDEAHHELRARSVEAWRALTERGVTSAIDWSGCLCWEHTGTGLGAQYDRLSTLGYPCEIVDAKFIKARCPNLAADVDGALWLPTEGAADTLRVTQDLLAAAAGYGAKLVYGLKVEYLVTHSDRVSGVHTAAGLIGADLVVLANGVGAPPLAEAVEVHIPLVPRPGAMIWTRPVEGLNWPVLVSPEMEFRQLPDGRFLAPTVAGHQGDTEAKLLTLPDRVAGEALLQLRRLTGLSDLQLESVAVGWRPVPKDGFPILGPSSVPGLYISVMHSGVTLAAIAGELITRHIGGSSDRSLTTFSPARFN